MNRKFNSFFYTIINSRTHYPSNDKTLFAQGVYTTKIKAEDLPPCYVKIYRGLWHYLKTEDIKFLKYKPNFFTDDALFKDDFLFISYDDEILPVEENRLGWFTNYDYVAYGWDICTILDGVIVYSPDVDIDEIIKALKEKIRWYWKKNPDKKEDVVKCLQSYQNLCPKLKLFG